MVTPWIFIKNRKCLPASVTKFEVLLSLGWGFGPKPPTVGKPRAEETPSGSGEGERRVTIEDRNKLT